MEENSFAFVLFCLQCISVEEKLAAAWSSLMKVCKWLSFGEKTIMATGSFVQVHPARYKKYYFGIQSDSLQKKNCKQFSPDIQNASFYPYRRV